MENVYKKDGTELKIMTEEDEKLIDIKDKLNLNDWYDVHNAYCSNGIVYITLMIRSGDSSSEKESQLINDSRYYPYGNAYGFVSIQSSESDVNKIMNTMIKSSGKVYAWIPKVLTYGEIVTFIYPLKS
ncbi:hypothetical protein KEC48_03990 [Clostridium sp. C1]|uniref:hypothetical protein n=1 Tax=Clostridium sp. C1 TaxID=1155388 RepID=UPI001BA61283|nr:hypothetical protein [Clostridium sp. C1]QUN13698.1 hypothetical protein KEC48_03990 [Clostridium sp. C1]